MVTAGDRVQTPRGPGRVIRQTRSARIGYGNVRPRPDVWVIVELDTGTRRYFRGSELRSLSP